MKLGIVGLPNVGKSTLFNSLTKAGAESANYPFCTIDPNVGVVPVPDFRLKLLSDLYNSEKITPAVIEFVDIAGLVKGASKGEGLGNQFLANIREVDAIVHVVRCFEDPNVIHVDGSVDPLRDIETINLELIFSDIEILDRRISKIGKQAKMDKTYAKELELVEAVKAHLEEGKMARTFEVPDDEDDQLWFKNYNLLTAKPTIYAANVTEDDLADDGASNPHVAKVKEMAKELTGDEKTGAEIVLKALEAPLYHIAANAGLEGSVIINKVAESEAGVGFDALSETYVNMVESGIIDPAKVTRSALQNATSVASTLLTTESVVADIKEDTPAPAMPAGGGMGMM